MEDWPSLLSRSGAGKAIAGPSWWFWEIYTFHVTDARSYESETSCVIDVCACLGRGAVWILHGPGFKTEVYFDA